MIVTEVEAKRYHVGPMIRMIREEHGALLAGLPNHYELVRTFESSMMRRTWFFDGRLAVMVGLRSSLADPEATLWMALAQHATAHPIHIARGALRYIDAALETKAKIVITVLREDKAGVEFAYFLGFHVEQPVDLRGREGMLMSMDREQRSAA